MKNMVPAYRALPTFSGLPSQRSIAEWFDRVAFNWKIRAELYRHLSTQIGNGIGQLPALELFHRRLLRRKRKNCAAVLSDVIRRMNDGAQLSVALRRWVPLDEAQVIMGSEVAGSVSKGFDLILQTKDRIAAVRKTMTSAFVTPAVYLLALYGLVWAIGTYLIPTIATVMPERNAQGMGLMLYQLGDAATSWWMLAPVAVLACLAASVVWALPNWTGMLRIEVERFFPFNFYRDIQGYVWVVTFAAMLRAGVPDTDVLDDQGRHGSPWLRQRLTAVRQRMLNGSSLSQALIRVRFGFPNPDLIEDIDSMSGFTDFPERIRNRANQWADELEWTTKARVKQVGFAFDLVMFALILFVLVGINSFSTQMGTVSPVH